jgi:hypothetical protein
MRQSGESEISDPKLKAIRLCRRRDGNHTVTE